MGVKGFPFSHAIPGFVGRDEAGDAVVFLRDVRRCFGLGKLGLQHFGGMHSSRRRAVLGGHKRHHFTDGVEWDGQSGEGVAT